MKDSRSIASTTTSSVANGIRARIANVAGCAANPARMAAVAFLLAVAPLGMAHGQNPPEAPAPRGPTMADFTKLQNEVREQRQLILQMLQSEQQRYEMILKLVRVQGGATSTDLARLAPAPSSLRDTEASADDAAAEPAAKGGAPENGNPRERGRRSGTVTGRVDLRGGDVGDTYVFVEDVKGPGVKGKTVEIRQEGKQFSPRLAVVQTGTSVVFPNLDSVYHNVFSNSPHNSFDLGSSRAGETPRAVRLTKTGVVEVYCNMHQKMSASILVVPGPLFTRVRSDGTFRLENVPVGNRKIVAWSPGAKSVEQRVSLTAAGTQIAFALEADERKAHLNKLGQAYGSYRE